MGARAADFCVRKSDLYDGGDAERLRGDPVFISLGRENTLIPLSAQGGSSIGRGQNLAERLSALETGVLKSIYERVDPAEMVKRFGVPAATLGKTIASLQLRGYLADDGAITEVGLRAIGM